MSIFSLPGFSIDGTKRTGSPSEIIQILTGGNEAISRIVEDFPVFFSPTIMSGRFSSDVR